ncbi:MAG: HPF/RaiA family ribosome-associated protein [Gemmatimonadetes bacterium]|nr:HPF/RaiA family ribosome-associated protein [Gemmatimonadota bacterium]
MEIVFSHRGIALTESMLKKAERAILKAAERIPRATAATVRFDEHGPERRVEIVFTAPRGTRLVASSVARFWGPALGDVLLKLVRQASKERRTPVRRVTTAKRS